MGRCVERETFGDVMSTMTSTEDYEEKAKGLGYKSTTEFLVDRV